MASNSGSDGSQNQLMMMDHGPQGHMVQPFSDIKQALTVSSGPENMQLAERMGQRTKMHNPGDLIELARYVQSADSHTKAMVGGKLELISEQIKLLQAQARRVLADAKKDVELTHAKCNFQRKPGNIYHLYKKTLGGGESETFFSMLSPNEYGGDPPHQYLASYRLEYDMSWTPAERIEQREKARQFNPAMLGLTNAEGTYGEQQLSLTMV
eukprot:m.132492 g.132492  ORF g.132492 m.132492 type:complete len:211 (+) comp17502_c0_seq1:213-845(+)